TDDEALSLMLLWNERCVPPWQEADLAKKIAGARKYGKEPYGTRAGGQVTKQGETAPVPGIRLAKGRTEAANAKRLIVKYRGEFRFARAWEKYVVWSGQRWCLDQTIVEDLAKRRAAELWEELVKIQKENPLESRALSKVINFIRTSNGATGVRNVL